MHRRRPRVSGLDRVTSHQSASCPQKPTVASPQSNFSSAPSLASGVSITPAPGLSTTALSLTSRPHPVLLLVLQRAAAQPLCRLSSWSILRWTLPMCGLC
ncbi:hypothetical protein F443_12425 [Phytophthora nicotianae P1569]|uniref:Uncharacterized protein n=1 Tax=Phytophthora nicotianae P1569 TaxID=1317065 RepID=V9EUA3_PHYNI|nr:hypothetical protein F443_12425 [Phytophthora nicotianae P1569]